MGLVDPYYLPVYLDLLDVIWLQLFRLWVLVSLVKV